MVVRNTWDYPSRRDAFLAWAEGVPRIVNPVAVLRWTTDKRYLVELESAGLPVVHTEFVDTPGRRVDPGADGVVVKPAIGVGSVGAGRHRDAGEAQAHVDELLAGGHAAMVQPFLPGIAERGETALHLPRGRVLPRDPQGADAPRQRRRAPVRAVPAGEHRAA